MLPIPGLDHGGASGATEASAQVAVAEAADALGDRRHVAVDEEAVLAVPDQLRHVAHARGDDRHAAGRSLEAGIGGSLAHAGAHIDVDGVKELEHLLTAAPLLLAYRQVQLGVAGRRYRGGDELLDAPMRGAMVGEAARP